MGLWCLLCPNNEVATGSWVFSRKIHASVNFTFVSYNHKNGTSKFVINFQTFVVRPRIIEISKSFQKPLQGITTITATTLASVKNQNLLPPGVQEILFSVKNFIKT